METSVIRQIHRLRQMTVGELQLEWMKLNGAVTRSRNRAYLWKRLAWRIQELRHGGLSDRAKARIDDLAPDGFVRARTPAWGVPIDEPAPVENPKPRRDLRLPSPGTVLTRRYHGSEIQVLVIGDGFEWDGRRFRSLSAVARAVTGQKWNGWLFFGLTERKRYPRRETRMTSSEDSPSRGDER